MDSILAQLASHQQELSSLVVESTYNWYWLVDGLMEAGYPVQLANTAAIQPYEGIKHSNDFTDAQWLAHLLRLNILPTGYIDPKEERGVRDLLRKRMQLVQQRTSNLLSIQTQAARHLGHAWSGNRIKKLTGEEVDEMVVDEHVALAITSNLRVMTCLSEQIRHLEKGIKGQAKLKPTQRPVEQGHRDASLR